MTKQTVLALYDDRASAHQVLEELRAAGYGSEFSVSGDGSSSAATSGGVDGIRRFDRIEPVQLREPRSWRPGIQDFVADPPWRSGE